MKDYDLLPVNNFKYGYSDRIVNVEHDVYNKHFSCGYTGGCWYSCSLACAKAADGLEYETTASLDPDVSIFNPLWTIDANCYAGHHSLGALSPDPAFVCECYELGLITKEHTNGLDLHFGIEESLMEHVHRMMDGKDTFSYGVGNGIRKMETIFSERCAADREIMDRIGMERLDMEVSQYRCQEPVVQGGGYFLAFKGSHMTKHGVSSWIC